MAALRYQHVADGHAVGIGPLGTARRLVFGCSAIVVAVVYEPSPVEIAAGSVGLPAAELLIVRIFRGPGEPPFKLYGLWGYALNYGIAFDLWLMWPLPALLFFGVSLLLAGVRGYAGCEILALSNLLSGRRDELACAILSPVDNIERSVMSRS